ncbi:MAG: RtcB family protein [Lewinellaceae bacterium]|nr:RtcB family protein [Lewinellaceae bacterium]
MSINKNQLIKLQDYLWELPKETRPDMRVPARVYALEELLDAILNDRSLEQLANVATLPGIVKASMVMPDVHEGYGFPIGGVAATRYPDGAISPGGIGYDINCGVRLLVSDLSYNQVKNRMEELSKEMYRQVPSGMGKGGFVKLSAKQMEQVLRNGAAWAVEAGHGFPRDLEYTESHGCLPDADPAQVSDQAKKRGRDQLGTIGSGNHFVEVGRVGQIFDEEAAAAYGLELHQITILIHTGSRGLGHQVATDYLRIMMGAMPKYGIQPPDRELACVPLSSPEGQDYFHAMCAAANFAWANRQVITSECRKAWSNVFGKSGGELRLLYDVAHNIAKVEEHAVDGERMKVIVHRKGATRAFGPHYSELPGPYRHIGQPVLIPGSMGTSSYVLAGTEESMASSFGSTCHGAGRRLSRRGAKKQVDAPKLIRELKEQGIHVQAGSHRGVAEEAPIAYKDVDLVVETVHQAGIAKRVARLKPLGVVKG